MRDLPALVVGRAHFHLPMCDRSAAFLAETLLEGCEIPGAEPNRVEQLSQHLALDPPLVVWSVLRARQRGAASPRTVTEAAEWLERHALAVLQWDDGVAASRAAPANRPEQWTDRVARSLQLAEMAARLAARRGAQAAEQAALAGMCHEARGWLTDAEMPSLPFPEGWPLGAAPSEVAEANEILAGRKPPPGPDCDPQACRERAAEGLCRWLEHVPGAGTSLPALAAQLARLRDLETRFQSALETEKLEALAEFAAGAGHEINNPLANISGRAQLLLRDEPHPQRRRELATIVAQAQRAHEMIADLRLFARPPRPEPRRTDLVRLVEEAIAELAPQASGRTVTIVRAGDPGPIEAEVDPVQIRVALHALVRNAIEAVGCEGRVEIAVRRRGEETEIRVSDDGPGIAAEHRRHLFDPFYSARQAGRGLGMGLSKAWRIATIHGGRMEVADAGRGAELAIVLPGAGRDEG